MRVMPGDVLFRIADHSRSGRWSMCRSAISAPWPKASRSSCGCAAIPDRTFAGKVALVYPHLNPATRTVRVRIELPNHDLAVAARHVCRGAKSTPAAAKPVLAVPDSAVIDSGDRQIVIVDKGDGRFEPRPVKLGRRGDGLCRNPRRRRRTAMSSSPPPTS